MQPEQPIIRPLTDKDLESAIEIQAEVFPEFMREDRAAFASRLAMPASFCLVATLREQPIAYILAHGWRRQSPPAIGTVLDPRTPAKVMFIHDLAVSRAGRGSGIGQRLVAQTFVQAAAAGLREAELIAVEGAHTYWRTLGFTEPVVPIALAQKVAEYGEVARWMARVIVAGEPMKAS